jgi:hypothetical protein
MSAVEQMFVAGQLGSTDLRDAALAALDSINPPNLFTYLCP